MAQVTFHFPQGFLWGAATASHQVEGNNTNNNWWAWEQEPGRIVSGHKSGLACDWWGGRWREDFDRAMETGQNAHRLSVEWSRIQPTPDRWDESALDRYREMLRGLRERGMTAMVTLHHFSDPLWLVEQGGWLNDSIPAIFEKFVRKVVEALKEYTSLWVTINEPNVYAASSFVLGAFPPAKNDVGAALHVMDNMIRAHAVSYRAIHSIQPQARVGIALNFRPFIPHKAWSPLDRLVSGVQDDLFNRYFPGALSEGVASSILGRKRFPEAKGTQDYVGINYYTQDLVSFNLFRPGDIFSTKFYKKDADLSTTGSIANEPEGFYYTLQWANRFNLPILVTENGVEDADDRMRPRYILQHIHQMWRGVNFNWPIKGYFHWTLVDNFEWERGWTQRFGLWELDVDTQARHKRPSADLYAEICKENGITSEMVAKYAPEIMDKLFP